MTDVEFYIQDFSGQQRKLLERLHYLLCTECGLTDKIRYKIPFYYGRSWICYLNPSKDGAVELGFIRGNELSNHHGLLDPKDRKQVCGITIQEVKEIPDEALRETIQEAILLDETTPYASKRTKK